MIKVSELKSNGVLPKKFLDILPTKCSYCGSELVITETLTVLNCTNSKCLEKGVQRMLLLLKDLGVKSLGESKCRAFLKKFKTNNPYAILLYEPSKDGVLYEGCSMDFSYSVYNKLNEVREMLLWEYVKIGNIEGLRDVARMLFSGYESIDGFYSDLYEYGVELVQDLMGLKVDSAVSVKAISVYNTLLSYESELRSSIVGVNLKVLDVPTLNICISSVGKPFKNKTEFIKEMNKLVSGKIHLNILSGVTKDCDYLIWSKDGNTTSKVNKAIKYDIPVFRGVEFEEYLKTRCL